MRLTAASAAMPTANAAMALPSRRTASQKRSAPGPIFSAAPNAVRTPATRGRSTWTDHQLNAIAGARKDVRLPPKIFAAKVGAKMAAATNACQRPLRMIHSVVASIEAALAAHQAHIPSQSGKNASGRHSTATKGGEIKGTADGGSKRIGRSPATSAYMECPALSRSPAAR